MSRLKAETVNQCFSLLREYIDEGPRNNKKRMAMLALNQLLEITAGAGSQGTSFNSNTQEAADSICTGRPRFESSPIEE